jgi:hypothetical protein
VSKKEGEDERSEMKEQIKSMRKKTAEEKSLGE